MKKQMKTLDQKYLSRGSIYPLYLLELRQGRAVRYAVICGSNLYGGCYSHFRNEREEFEELWEDGTRFKERAKQQFDSYGSY